MKPRQLYLLPIIFACIQSCSKSKDETFIPCAEKIIELSLTSSASAGCGSNSGSIVASATGSRGFSFRINSAPFQPSGNFKNLSNGSYIITARDTDGCEKSKMVQVTSGIVAGPKFTALKNLFVMRCNRCHSGISPAASKDWSTDCLVIENKQVINTRAVVVGDMPRGGPELSASEKAIITDWLAAGGMIEN